MKKQIHANTLASYRTGALELLPKRQQKIVGILRKIRAPLTDREIMVHLHYADMNSVRPSITRLVELGVLVETGNRYDFTTGRTVRLCYLAPVDGQTVLDLQVERTNGRGR